MFKQFARRRRELKEKKELEKYALPSTKHQSSVEVNCIPFKDLKLGKCYQMLTIYDSMENFRINKILVLAEISKYQIYYNSSSRFTYCLDKDDLNIHKELTIAFIPADCSVTTVEELSDYSEGFTKELISEDPKYFFYEDLTKLKSDLEYILKQRKLDREEEIAKQIEKDKQSKLKNLNESFKILQNKVDNYFKK